MSSSNVTFCGGMSSSTVPCNSAAQPPAMSSGIEPSGIEPRGIEPSGIEPSGIEPSGIEPNGESARSSARSSCASTVGANWFGAIAAGRTAVGERPASGTFDPAAVTAAEDGNRRRPRPEGASVTSRKGRTAGSAASRDQYRAQYAVFGPAGQLAQLGLYSSIESLRSPARSMPTRLIRSAVEAANDFGTPVMSFGKTLSWLPAGSVRQVFRNMKSAPRARGDDRTSPPVDECGVAGGDGAVGGGVCSR